MDPITIGVVGMAVFLLLLLFNVPVGVAMSIVGLAGFAWLVSWEAAIGKAALIPFTTVTDYNFAVVPAFILMAQIFGVTGMGARLYDLCEKWLGFARGGLAMATIFAAAIFSAISSSTIATVVTIGAIAIPEMMRRRYDPGFAGATVAAAGGLGILIPPSSILILYGLMTEQSIRELFRAGIVPGLALSVAYAITVAILCRMRPTYASAGVRYSMKEKWKALLHVWETILLILLTLGGLFTGWFTPTEAGAVGASGAMLIGLARRKLTFHGLMQALKATTASSGMVALILVGGFLFNYFIAVTGMAEALIQAVESLKVPATVAMLVVTLAYLILGTFMDSLAMLLLTIPIMFPFVQSLGYDPIWFGIYVVMVMEMANLSPPVGLNVFVLSGLVRDMSLDAIFRRVTPFVIAQLVVTLLMIYFPDFVTFVNHRS